MSYSICTILCYMCLIIFVYVKSLRHFHTQFHYRNEAKSSICLSSANVKKTFGSKGKNEVYFCDQCGVEHVKWVGRCTSCKEWNTVKPFRAASMTSSISRRPTNLSRFTGNAGIAASADASSMTGSFKPLPLFTFNSDSSANMIAMNTIDTNKATSRLKLFSNELNRVLGNGLVQGSVTLIAGEPGVGKSTLLIQLASTVANPASTTSRSTSSASTTTSTSDATSSTASINVIYISGEENPEQIASRAHRLGLSAQNIYLICDINVDAAVENILSMSQLPSLIIVDSVQTMRTETCTNAIGSVTQIRDCTSQFIQLAKSTGCPIILVGHVTKTGEVAGPRVLEHMVDTVLYMEGSEKIDYRLLRSIKNRFGSTSEVGVFSMTEAGLTDVSNPSELFMSNSVLKDGLEGSAVAVIMEGSRPILAEIQCLVSDSYSKISQPRRTSDGLPIQRLLLLCAIIEKRVKLSLYNKDIYLNVVGGLRLNEPAADLAVAMTIVSSLTGVKIKPGIAFIGELGLNGEIRGGKRVEVRITEALKMGFSTVIVPGSLRGKNDTKSQRNVIYCNTLRDAIDSSLNIDNTSKLFEKKRRTTSSSSSYVGSRGSSSDSNEYEDSMFTTYPSVKRESSYTSSDDHNDDVDDDTDYEH